MTTAIRFPLIIEEILFRLLTRAVLLRDQPEPAGPRRAFLRGNAHRGGTHPYSIRQMAAHISVAFAQDAVPLPFQEAISLPRVFCGYSFQGAEIRAPSAVS